MKRLRSIWIAMRADELDWMIPGTPSRTEAVRLARTFSGIPEGQRWRAVRFVPTALGHYRRESPKESAG